MPIQLLPDSVIARIAAGEAVERPASVVKELVENALDAEASQIHVEIVDSGQRRIRVSDDGVGIPTNEVHLALTRHATSKLRDADELERIRTLGFRGEALASVAAVSHLSLVTRCRDEELGLEVQVMGGELRYEKPIGAPAGTVITVENLFYNTPARLKFLKSANTEKRHVQSVITQYAMAYPAVRFVLVQDGREVFRSPGSGQFGDVVVKVFGLDHFKEMIEIRGSERIRETGEDIHVRGFVSKPTLHRKDRTRIHLFVNGRSVQDSGLTYAVTQAYHTLIEKGRHPFAVLKIDLPPHFVDVNVHPTKAEVRFQDTNVVFTAVQRTTRRAVLGEVQAAPHNDLRPQAMPSQRGWTLPYDKERIMDADPTFDEADPIETVDDLPANATAIPMGKGKVAKPRTLPVLRIVGQVGAAYLVAEGPAGMYLIDQHAAHTRVLYQELTDLLAQQEQLPARTISAASISLTDRDVRVVESYRRQLERCGFQLEPFGPNTFRIESMPAVIASGNPVDVVWTMVEILHQPDQTPSVEERLLIRVAVHGAIKSGQILNLDEMRNLVRKLERSPNPQRSPTGEVTLIHMSADELQRQFIHTPSDR